MTKEELLRQTDLFLFDLDGTVYLDNTPIPGAPEALSRLRKTSSFPEFTGRVCPALC